MISLSLLACVPAPAPSDVPAAVLEALPATTLARRLALDLRGRPPTLEEYDQVLADPAALDTLTEQWIVDEGFEARVQSMYSELYLTQTETLPFSGFDLGVDDPAAFAEAVGTEPLRLIARIAAMDRPWTDIVTADHTMANDVLATAFPIDLPEGEGWREATYTDGRPAAGVLSTTGLWWRYTSTASNANRKRANQISRILLCNDYLTRPVEFDRNVNLLDEGAVLDALQTDPTCVSCHVSLDPLAGYLYGFWWLREDSAIDASRYHPSRERLWEDLTGVAPAYYGEPGHDLRDLGVQIASDPRFIECATEQVYGLMLRRDLVLEDTEALTAHREAFLAGGVTLRALLRSIVSDPLYRAANTEDPLASPLKLASPDLLGSQIEALTGYRWTFAGYDMLSTDIIGVRTLAGGADGYAVTKVSDTPNATAVLVQQRLAEIAVAHAMQTDPARLFGDADLDAVPTGDQVTELMLRILGTVVAPDGEEVDGLLDLWSQIEVAEGDAQAAWAGIAYALMRDPAFVLY